MVEKKVIRGEYESHPQWNKLCEMCGTIERLQSQSKYLREQIDKEIFNEKWVTKQNNEIK